MSISLEQAQQNAKVWAILAAGKMYEHRKEGSPWKGPVGIEDVWSDASFAVDYEFREYVPPTPQVRYLVFDKDNNLIGWYPDVEEGLAFARSCVDENGAGRVARMVEDLTFRG